MQHHRPIRWQAECGAQGRWARAPQSARQFLFSPQPVDTVSDKLAADREPDWPQTEKTCPPTGISDGRCHTSTVRSAGTEPSTNSSSTRVRAMDSRSAITSPTCSGARAHGSTGGFAMKRPTAADHRLPPEWASAHHAPQAHCGLREVRAGDSGLLESGRTRLGGLEHDDGSVGYQHGAASRLDGGLRDGEAGAFASVHMLLHCRRVGVRQHGSSIAGLMLRIRAARPHPVKAAVC